MQSPALGVFAKPDDGQLPDRIWAKGEVLKCASDGCAALEFKPHLSEAPPVECVLLDILTKDGLASS
jgi:hypothetical protein